MENKIPAFPILSPLSKATSTTLDPIKFWDTDFLEIDLFQGKERGEGMHFITEAVSLKHCEPNMLSSADDAACPEYVQTPEGAFYKPKGHYNYPSSVAASKWYNRIPERKQIGYGKYKLAGTDYTALVIHHVWPHSKLIFKSEEAILLYTYLLRRFFAQSISSTMAAEFKLTGVCPKMPKDFIEHKTLPLTDYQKVAMLISMETSSYSLFMEQGTGKTPVVINRICLEAARKRAKENKMYKALIVCPQQVRRNWEKEFTRFAVVPGKTVILQGGKLGGTRALLDGTRDENDCAWAANIVSIDSVRSMWDAIKLVRWDLVVLDESHKIKNSQTGRYKSLMKLTDAHAINKMILTGTPITNTPFDLWAQFEWLSPGLSGFSTYANYRSFHDKWENELQGGTAVAKLIGFKNVPLIQERLARLSFLFRKSDMKPEDQLPDKVYDTYECQMIPQQAAIYKQVAEKLVTEIDIMLEKGKANGNLTIEHILTKLMRLAQICSGFVKLDDAVNVETETVTRGAVVQISDKNPKIDAIIDMIREDWENDSNSKCIIWACFIEDLAAMSKRLDKEGINFVGYHKAIHPDYRVRSAAEAEDKMNLDDNCRVLLANPSSAGIGQNFMGFDVENPDASSMYVNHHIYFSCNWSAVDRIQSEDRSHRRGTRTNLRITDLVVPYTIDEEIRNRVTAKRDMAMSIQDIRNILNSVLSGYGS